MWCRKCGCYMTDEVTQYKCDFCDRAIGIVEYDEEDPRYIQQLDVRKQ